MSADTIADLLMLARLDEVEAITVGEGDHINGSVPPWCEIVLDVTGEGERPKRLHLTRHDGELIIEVLHTILHPAGGPKTVQSRLWAELDDVMEYLMDVDEPQDEDRARARTLAECLAMLTQPYSEEPDVDVIRAQAVERWEARNS